MIVVKSKLKEMLKDYNISGDFSEALDNKVKEIVKEASKRAEANNRRTVMAKDL
ncbi:MAG: DUF1931 domain-containing protein [Nanobdellota archaeon]